MTDRIQTVFDSTKSAKKSCFIAYLCAGDPDYATSLAACKAAIENGIDILEIGVPFSDPLADGLTNQLAAQRALESGMDQKQVFQLVRDIRAFSEIPIVFYTYYNLVFSMGEQAYAETAKAAGVDGMLVLDLPPEESETWLKVCDDTGLKTVFIVAPTTPPERVQVIRKATTGFIYYVSRTGVTGERSELADDLGAMVKSIKDGCDLPVVVGFGVSTPEQVKAVAEVADGVVVGSTIVNCIGHNIGDHEKMIKTLGEKVAHLVSGLE